MCTLLANRINRVPKKSFAVLTEETHLDQPSVFSNLSKPNSIYHRNCIVPDENYSIRLYSIGGKIQPSPPPHPRARFLQPLVANSLIQTFYTPSKEFFNRVSTKLKIFRSTVAKVPAVETKREKRMDKPMFITTVRQGTFLEPPPEVAVLLGLRKNNFNDKFISDTSNDRRKMFYLFSSKPRIIKSDLHRTISPASNTLTERPSHRQKREIKSMNENTEGSTHYGNTMYDRRVARGSNFASSRSNPTPVEPLLNRQAEARRRAAVRQRAQIRARKLRMRTPPPVDGRKHEQMQTDSHYLEELTERPSENSIACQAALSFDDSSTTSTLQLYKNTGIDAETQIDPGDLPEYDDETHSVAIASIVKNILQEAILEINDEIQNTYRNIFINESKVTKTTNLNEIQSDENTVIITKEELRLLINGVIPGLMSLASSKIRKEIENSDVFVSKILDEIRNEVKNENFISGIIKTHLQNWSNITSQNSSFEKQDENLTNDSDSEPVQRKSSIETDLYNPENTETISNSSHMDQNEIPSPNENERELGEQKETDSDNQNTETKVFEQEIVDKSFTMIKNSMSLVIEQNNENEVSTNLQVIQTNPSTHEHGFNTMESQKNIFDNHYDTNFRGKFQHSLTEKSEVKKQSVIRSAASEDMKSNITLAEFLTKTSEQEDQKQLENIITIGNGFKTEVIESNEIAKEENNEKLKNEFTVNNQVEVEVTPTQQCKEQNADNPKEKSNYSSTDVLDLNKDNIDINDDNEQNTWLTDNQIENPKLQKLENEDSNMESIVAIPMDKSKYQPDKTDEKMNKTLSLYKKDNTVISKTIDEKHETNEQTILNTRIHNNINLKENLKTNDKSLSQEISETPKQSQESVKNDVVTQNLSSEVSDESPTQVDFIRQETNQQESIEKNTDNENAEKCIPTTEFKKEEPSIPTVEQLIKVDKENEINQDETLNGQNQSNNLAQNYITTAASITQINFNNSQDLNFQASSQSNNKLSKDVFLSNSSKATYTISSMLEIEDTKTELITSKVKNAFENEGINENQMDNINEPLVDKTEHKNRNDSVADVQYQKNAPKSHKTSPSLEELPNTTLTNRSAIIIHATMENIDEARHEIDFNSNTNSPESTASNYQTIEISSNDQEKKLDKSHFQNLENKAANATEPKYIRTNTEMESGAHDVEQNKELDQQIILSKNEMDLNKPAKIPNGKLVIS